MRILKSIFDSSRTVMLWLICFAGLYITKLYSYTLFHSLTELFSVVIAACIFIVAWNARYLMDNHYLLLVGIGYLFVGMIDVLHTLAYKGMGVFPEYGANLPTQFWIIARYMESATLLVAPFFISRRLNQYVAFFSYGISTLVLLLTIFYWDIFPDCFIDGVGLTTFKRISEYLICLILLVSIIPLIQNRKTFDLKVLKLVVCSVAVTAASEFMFTLYMDVYGLFNMVGHFLKVISFYLVYKALVVTALQEPYNLLFMNLQKSERLYHTLASNIPKGAVLLFDEDCRYFLAEGLGLALLGLSKESIEGKMLCEVFPAGMCEMLEQHHMAALRGEERLFEFSCRDRTFLANAVPIKNEDGGIFAGMVMSQDITGRKRMELAIKESEELFRSLAENSLTGVALYRDKFQYVNGTFERITGYSRDELLDMNVPQLFHPDYRENIGNIVHKRMNGEKLLPPYDELRIIKKNGDERWIQAYANTVEYNGQFCGLVNLVDVTEQKELEAELIKSRKLESIGILAGGVAHDFNNLMAIILGNVGLAKLHLTPNEPACQSLLNAEKAILLAKDLTNQFITLSRAGVPFKQVRPIRQLIEECVELILKEDPERWEIMLPDDLWQVEIDQEQMRQALLNILNNAKEATIKQGRINITAQNIIIDSIANRPSLRMKDGPHVRIRISDNGRGIAPRDLPFIFDPYFSTKERGTQKGMGFGLAITQSIVNNHNGHIEVYSELAKGTVVTIWLPAIQRDSKG